MIAIFRSLSLTSVEMSFSSSLVWLCSHNCIVINRIRSCLFHCTQTISSEYEWHFNSDLIRCLTVSTRADHFRSWIQREMQVNRKPMKNVSKTVFFSSSHYHCHRSINPISDWRCVIEGYGKRSSFCRCLFYRSCSTVIAIFVPYILLLVRLMIVRALLLLLRVAQ